MCSTHLSALVIDELPAGSGAYITNRIAAIPGMDLTHEEAVTLEADGLTIIGMTGQSAAQDSRVAHAPLRPTAPVNWFLCAPRRRMPR